MKAKLEKIKDKVYREFCNAFDIHLSSAPLISGDTFRTLADHCIESTDRFCADLIKEKDVVFVKSDLIDFFFNVIYPKINNHFVLISHNSDKNILPHYEKFLIEGKIIQWYAQNACFKHEKMMTLPIGLENLNYFANGKIEFFQNFFLKNSKENKILVSFNVNTNREKREPCLAFFKKYSQASIYENFLSSNNYIKTLAAHKFVASPEGNGVDCHRTWEAMYLGVVPIVKRNAFIGAFENLPIWIVDDWLELGLFDEKMLSEKYESFQGRDQAQLYFSYYEKMLTDQIRR